MDSIIEVQLITEKTKQESVDYLLTPGNELELAELKVMLKQERKNIML